ncbi:MAG: F0F1 ATP synthase subunit B [Balneolaceae bacterium]
MYFLAGGGGILSFESGFAIWVAISMAIFLYLMYKYAVPPIMNALDEREKRIKESLESAEKALEKAEAVAKDNEKALRDAEIQAQNIRKQALADAELLRSERIEKAKEEAAKILTDARETIQQEKKRALTELRNEVADLAVKSASIILDSELDKEKNKKLVNNFITNLHRN